MNHGQQPGSDPQEASAEEGLVAPEGVNEGSAETTAEDAGGGQPPSPR